MLRAIPLSHLGVSTTRTERGSRLSCTKNLLLAALLLAPLAATAEDAKAPTVKFGGTVDAYYLLNLDTPQSEVNPVRAGDPVYDGQPGFNLGYAKLAIDVDADPVGLKLDLAFGPEGAQITNNTVQQAYAFMKFGKATLALGRFVTPAGFEVFEQKDNWLASKGLIFSWAVPTAHEGVRLSYPLTPELTVTGYVANPMVTDKGSSR